MIPDFPSQIVIAGIDTDAGKSVVAALFTLGLDADYWKPVQAGLAPPTDTEFVRAATGLPAERFRREAYRLNWPASPHAAAERDGVRIEMDALHPPLPGARPLVIEGAGGLMVPLREDLLFIDVLAAWKLPVVLVVRTYLGCINHSLLSLEALRTRSIPLAGIVFNEAGRPESEAIIAQYAQAPVLGKVPQLAQITPQQLLAVWKREFSRLYQ